MSEKFLEKDQRRLSPWLLPQHLQRLRLCPLAEIAFILPTTTRWKDAGPYAVDATARRKASLSRRAASRDCRPCSVGRRNPRAAGSQHPAAGAVRDRPWRRPHCDQGPFRAGRRPSRAVPAGISRKLRRIGIQPTGPKRREAGAFHNALLRPAPAISAQRASSCAAFTARNAL